MQHRLVPDWAVKVESVIPEYNNGGFVQNHDAYFTKDTIPINTHWTDKQAVAVLEIKPEEWDYIYRLYPNWLEKAGNRNRKGYSQYLSDLIALKVGK